MLINEYFFLRKRTTTAIEHVKKRKKEDATNKTHLDHERLPTSGVRDVDQIRLQWEGSQAGRLERLPPTTEPLKVRVIVLGMNLELKLADGEVAIEVTVDERGKRVKLRGFHINFEDVDESVSWQWKTQKIRFEIR